MNMDSPSLEPEDWFWLPKGYAKDILASNITWPFSNVTMEEFSVLFDMLSQKKNLQWITQISGSFIPGIGIILTMLLIGTLWRKAVVQKNTFFFIMLVISILDLIFNILDMIFNLCYRLWKVRGSSNYCAMWIIAGLRGLAYSMSLASDMCTLSVTVERLVAIGHPHFYKNLPATMKTRIWRVVMVVIFMVSATRMHYTMAMDVVSVGPVYMYIQSNLSSTPFVVGLATFSDAITPLILVIAMTILSTKFRIIVIKRERLKVHPDMVSNVSRTPQMSPRLSVPKQFLPGPQLNTLHVPHSPQISPRSVHSGNHISMACPGPVNHVNDDIRSGQRSPKAESQAERNSKFKSIVFLTLALDVLMMSNNFGYCLYYAGELALTRNRISYSSTYDELSSFCYVQNFEGYASLTAVTVECLTRAINFPLYMTLSQTLRKEFRDFRSRLVKK